MIGDRGKQEGELKQFLVLLAMILLGVLISTRIIGFQDGIMNGAKNANKNLEYANVLTVESSTDINGHVYYKVSGPSVS